MNVVSLFDGMSSGQIALSKTNIKVDNYFASEINQDAVKVTMANYPNTQQLGDVTNIRAKDLPKIDILLGGSPCQGFSSSGKGLNFDDPRSKLFFEYARILKEAHEINPNIIYLLENVVMKQKYQNIITEHLFNIGPVCINSKLVSAQNRSRLYWTNIGPTSQDLFGNKFSAIPKPKDRKIKLADILEIDETQNAGAFNKATIVGRRLDHEGHRHDYNKTVGITQCLEVRKQNRDKSNCLTTVEKDNVLTPLPIGRYPDVYKKKLPFRYYTLKEYCRLQNVPDNYFDGIVSEAKAKEMLGNGWTVDVIAYILNLIEQ